MMTQRKKQLLMLTAALVASAVITDTSAADYKPSGVTPSFAYNLSDFTGTVPFDWVRLAVDEERNEIYVVSEGVVRIFNERGMELFHFGDNADFGGIYDLAVVKDGFILVLAYKDNRFVLTHCDFRGEPIREVEIKNLPQELKNFSPNRMVYRKGLLYLASLGQMKVVVADADYNFKEYIDLAALMGLKDEERADHGLVGFNIDSEGSILFTVPTLARAYVLSPDRGFRSFGKRGSAPGRFGIPADIVRDVSGKYFFVADTLRCVVLVFDNDLRYVTEFGYRGFRPGNLIGPRNLAVDSKGMLYVTQLRGRGVSVFTLAAGPTASAAAANQGGTTKGGDAHGASGAAGVKNVLQKFMK